MNLLAKDKYRTKIMQHVLHHYANDSPVNESPKNDTHKFFDGLQNIKYQCEKIYSSMLFQKVSKQKALISDSQDIDKNVSKNTPKPQVFNKSIKQKENHNYNNNKPSKSQTKPSKITLNEQASNMLLHEVQPRNHLHKQAYVYHQKLPMMSLSKQFDEQILKKLKKNPKIKQNQNKENNQKESNNINESQNKDKKYRFIAPKKVAQALKSRRQIEVVEKDKIKQTQDNNNTCAKGGLLQKMQCKQQKQQCNQLTMFNSTNRSKGSKQMMEFLQSAKQRLFQNINHRHDIQFQHQSSQKCINNCNQAKQSLLENKKLTNQHSQISSQTFKIQIQVSPTKTCQLSLTLQSNPEQIAKSFILSNKHQLSSFSDSQLKKLQQLLSRKIQIEIEKQSKLLEIKKEKATQQKYRQVIDHVGVSEMLLNDVEEDNVKQNNAVDSINNYKLHQKRDIQKKKKNGNKLLQYSHIYIQNIDHPFLMDEDKQTIQKLYNDSLSLKKLVSFNPKHIFQDNSIQQVSLNGYVNSPHELITYRPSESKSIQNNDQNHGQQQQSHDSQNNQAQISHFPLSASLSEFPKLHNNNKTQQVQQQIYISNHFQSTDIGAAKILSKSRSKLLVKNKNQNHPLNQPLKQNTSNPVNQHQHNAQSQQSKQIPFQTSDSPPASATVRSINSISSQIISRIGKQNILNSIKQKQLTKRQKILKEKQTKQNQQLKECSFKPKINNLSKSIDQNKKKKIKIGQLIQSDCCNADNILKNSKFVGKQNSTQYLVSVQHSQNMKQSQQFGNIMQKLQKSRNQTTRYQDLYENHKEIQARKEYIRQKSLDQISFKPEINKISKKIMQTKRNSLNNSTCQQYYSLANSKTNMSRHHSTCKKPQQKRHSLHYGNESYQDNQSHSHHHNKRKSLNFSRNLEGLQIGEYLYKQAMRMKKKKQSVPQSKTQNFRPLHKSQQIINKVKEKKLTEYFYELLHVENQSYDAEYDFVLQPQCINLEDSKFTTPPLRYLLPLLQELKELDVSLNKEEFIESGLKLISCLSQDEKAQFLGKKSLQKDQFSKQSSHQPNINKLSQQLIEKKQYYLQDIYHRGILYKKQIKDKVELDMENKVRKQLQKCTFKPKVNTNYQSIQ